MAVVASITISGTVSSLQTGSKSIAVTLSFAAAAAQVQEVVLALGANTITLPTVAAQGGNQTSGCIIVLPITNSSITTLKGVTGDTGIALGKTSTQVITWDPTAPPTNFVLTSVSAQTNLNTEITFF